MRKFKLFHIVLCLLLSIMVVSGCGNSGKTSESDTGTREETAGKTYTIDNIRDYVVGVDEQVELKDGSKKTLINFDNAATTPALQPVVDEVTNKLAMYGSIGRGFSQKSNYSTDIYNNTRDKVLDFVGADPEQYTCFYVNNTTDGLNKLASALIESKDALAACKQEQLPFEPEY